jgi:hypothetical protein
MSRAIKLVIYSNLIKDSVKEEKNYNLKSNRYKMRIDNSDRKAFALKVKTNSFVFTKKRVLGRSSSLKR